MKRRWILPGIDTYIAMRPVARLYHGLRLHRLRMLAAAPPFTLRVLAYHDIPSRHLEAFRRGVVWLKANCTVLSPREFERVVAQQSFVHGISVFLTFDDGTRDQYEAALEVLEPLGVQAAFSVPTAYVGRAQPVPMRRGSLLYPMTWDQVRSLHQRGHRILAHSHTHPLLGDLQPQEVARELDAADAVFRDELGEVPPGIAYPYGGNLDEIGVHTIYQCCPRFDYVLTFVPGPNHLDRLNPYALWRHGVRPDMGISFLRLLLDGGLDWRKRGVRREILRHTVNALVSSRIQARQPLSGSRPLESLGRWEKSPQ